MNEAAPQPSPHILEQLLIQGDLSSLSAAERLSYYEAVCKSLGLNPLTKPFAYIKLNGKLVLYALRDCTEQLRKLHGISIAAMTMQTIGDVYVVSAEFRDRTGRTDQATGAVPIKGLQGENLANAYMKAETKCKRRGTLSMCGLGMLDETEVLTIEDAEKIAQEKFKPVQLRPTAIEESRTMAELLPDQAATMMAAGTVDVAPPSDRISEAARQALEKSIRELSSAVAQPELREKIKDAMARELGCEHFADLTPPQYDVVVGWVAGKRKKTAKKTV